MADEQTPDRASQNVSRETLAGASTPQTIWHQLPAAAEELVLNWLTVTAAEIPADLTSDLDSDLVTDPSADLDFTTRLLELIAAPQDALLAALGLRKLTKDMPETLTPKDRLVLRTSGGSALGMPWAVMPLTKRWLRGRLANLLCVATLPSEADNPAQTEDLREVLTTLSDAHTPAAAQLHGEIPLGPAGAGNELSRLLALAKMPELEYLTVSVTRLAPGDDWAAESRIIRAVAALRELITVAADHQTRVLIDAASYSEAHLAQQVTLRLLESPELTGISFGYTLRSEMPEAAQFLNTIAVRAAGRQRAGGSALEIRLTSGSTLDAESTNSILTGLTVPVLADQVNREAALLRLLRTTLDSPGLTPVLVSDNPYTVAAAQSLSDLLRPEAVTSKASGADPALLKNPAAAPQPLTDLPSATGASPADANSAGASVADENTDSEEFDPNATVDVSALLSTRRGDTVDLSSVRAAADGSTNSFAETVTHHADEPTRDDISAASAHGLSGNHSVIYEIRSGIAPELVRVLHASANRVRIALPLVPPSEFGAAVPYLVDLAAEAADPASALANQHILNPNNLSSPEGRYQQLATLERACEQAQQPAPQVHRTQDRTTVTAPSDRDSGLFYRPTETVLNETGGLTAAVLGLSEDSETGEIVVDSVKEHRTVPVVSTTGFASEPVTDPLSPINRRWMRSNLEAAGQATTASKAGSPGQAETASGAGRAGSATGASHSPDAATDAIHATTKIARSAVAAQSRLGVIGHQQRGKTLRQLGFKLTAERAQLTTLLARHSGANPVLLDDWANYLIDSCRYLAQQTEDLSYLRGAEYQPRGISLIACDESAVACEVAEQLLANFAAGNATVISAPASTAALLSEFTQLLQSAGLPQQASQAVSADEVATTELVQRVQFAQTIVLGSAQLAREITRVKPETLLTGRNTGAADRVDTVLITPAADYRLAAAAVVENALTGIPGGYGKPKALILLGSAARNGRLRELLADAARSIKVGYSVKPSTIPSTGTGTSPGTNPGIHHSAKPADQNSKHRAATIAETAAATARMQNRLTPLATPVTDAERRALTELDRGETWLVTPRQLDSDGRSWSPGIKLGVSPQSEIWQHLHRIPLLAVTSAHSLSDAVRIQNQLGAGTLAALYSHDSAEMLPWIDSVRAATLFVNQRTLRPRVERCPAGSWGSGVLNSQTLSGGPNQLVPLGSWRIRPGTQSGTLHLRGLEPAIQQLIEAAQHLIGYESFDRVRRAALADELSWRTEYGIACDVSGLGVEHNLLRYLPVPTVIRLTDDGAIDELLRVLIAGILVNAPLTVSTGSGLPPDLHALLTARGLDVHVESDDYWLERIAVRGALVGQLPAGRIRLIGGDPARVAEWLGSLGGVSIWADPVTMAGPVELLSFLREQAISISTHRYGLLYRDSRLSNWLREVGR